VRRALSLAALAWAIAGGASAQVTTYPPAFFAEARPATALDMVERLPGFTFEEAMPSTDLSSGTAYLPKPFDAATLTHKVRELLRASHASREAASSR
jgi:hypothetical protein